MMVQVIRSRNVGQPESLANLARLSVGSRQACGSRYAQKQVRTVLTVRYARKAKGCRPLSSSSPNEWAALVFRLGRPVIVNINAR